MRVLQTATGEQTGDYALTRTEFQILRKLVDHPGTLWDLLASVDGTVMEIYGACRALYSRGWIVFENERVRVSDLPQKVKQACRLDFDVVVGRLEKLRAEAPRPTTKFFQEPIASSDVVKRVQFLWERGDLFERSILILGDDDLLSLAAGLTGLPKRVVVGEIDPRWVEFIATQAQRNHLPVEVHVYNVADPLPREWRRAFDVFVMDPVETRQGFKAWLSRGLAAIKHPGSVFFGLTELECPAKYWHEFQRLINEAGLVLTDILRDHSRYENRSLQTPEAWRQTRLVREAPFPLRLEEQCSWYRSSFCRAVTVKTPQPPLRGKIRFGRSFYKGPYTVTLEE
ncbi:bis-aminopropyl spermidine synthase family protein [Thermogutta sp.]|uniref:bis-aminopropyl spermidine synthase family protein n=1 Tax=Thermogutta sp. TaxID=1962930 RepID=UPI0032200636